MDRATPLSGRAQARECNETSKVVIQYMEQEFQSLLSLRSPSAHALLDGGSTVAQMRTSFTDAGQQISKHELEIEALRAAILFKHEDLVRISNAHARKVDHINDLLRVMNRNPRLPVEIILRIFELLYSPESVDQKIKSTQDLSLYRISVGFADLPGWQKAIRAQIPLVLVPEAPYWKYVNNKLSLMSEVTLGHHPRLCGLNDLPALAQVGILEVAATYMAIDEPYFRDHLAAVRHFKHRSLIFSAPSFQKLSEGLDAAGDMLWRAESLEIVLGKRPNEVHDEAFLWPPDPDQGITRLPRIAGEFKPSLRRACLPFGALHGCRPLLTRITSLELQIQSNDFDVENILAGLRTLPETIMRISLRCEFHDLQNRPTQDIKKPASLLNLVELSIREFSSRTTNTLIKCFESPHLESLATKFPLGTPEDRETEKKGQYEFLAIASKLFPHLKVLKRATTTNLFRSALPFLCHLMKPDATEVADEEGEWLLPTLEVLDVLDVCDDLLEHITSVASARLKSDKVASLRSVTIPSSDLSMRMRAQNRTRGVADVWRDTQFNALRVLVPDVKIVSDRGAGA